MSKEIEERVVEMRFDNKQFEKGAGETLGTLQKLKNALSFKGASDGLNELGRTASNVNLNPLAAGVEAVKHQFSALEAVALTTLVNITNRTVDAGIALAKSLSVDQITAGWEKYAQKTSAVQTIMAATAQDFTDTGEQMEYVNAQLEKLNWFTDETSYNFVDMVGNIGKFTSNNIHLDDAVTSMQGIATWAALSGANANEASRAMYNLAQAVAVGSVKLIDWKSIENANMATAGFKEVVLETAVSLGTLKRTAKGVYETIDKGTEVTIANFNSALSEGWFTSEVLLSSLDQYGAFTNKLYEVSEATDLTATELLQWMDKYRDAGQNNTKVLNDMAKETGKSVSELTEYMSELTDETYALGEKAFRAAQEAKTFQEAIDATKDAVSTGWMKTWELIFGDYETAKVRWTALANELYDVFAAAGDARNDMLKKALSVPTINEAGWDKIASRVEKAGAPVDKFIDKLVDMGVQAGKVNKDMIASMDDFVDSLEDGWLTVDMIHKLFREDPKGLRDIFGQDWIRIGRILQGISSDLGEVRSGSDLLFDGISKGWNTIKNIFTALKNGWEVAFPPMTAERLYNILAAFNSLATRFSTWVGEFEEDGTTASKLLIGLQSTAAGLGSVFGIAFDIIKEIAIFLKDSFSGALGGSIEKVFTLTGGIGEAIVSFREWLKETGAIRYVLEKVSGVIARFIEKIRNLINEFKELPWVQKIVENIQTAFSEFCRLLTNSFPEASAEIGSFFAIIKEAARSGDFSKIKDSVWQLATALGNDLEAAFEKLGFSLPQIKQDFKDIWAAIKTLDADKLPEWARGIYDVAKIFLGPALGILGEFGKVVMKTAKSADNAFGFFKDVLSEAARYLKEHIGGIIAALALFTTSVIIVKFLKTVFDLAKLLSAPIQAITSAFKSIGEAAKGLGRSFNAFAFIEVAIALSILALVAAKVGSQEGLWKGVAAISVLTIFVGLVVILMQTLSKKKELKPENVKNSVYTFLKILMLSGAILSVILAFSTLIKTIESLGENKMGLVWETIGIMVGSIVALAALLLGIEAISKKFKLANTQISANILIMALSVGAVAAVFIGLVKALKDTPMETVVAAIVGLTACVVAIAALMTVVKLLRVDKKAAVNLVAASIAIKLLISVIKELGAMRIDQFNQGEVASIVYGLLVILGIIAILILEMNAMKGTSWSAGVGLLSAAASIAILVVVIKELAKIDAGEIAKGLVAIGFLMLFMALFVKMTSKGTQMSVKSSFIFITLAVTLAIMVGVIALMTLLRPEDIAIGIAALGSLMVFISLVLAASWLAKDVKLGTFIGLAIVIGVISAAVILMSLLSPEQVLIGTAALSALLIAVGFMFLLMAAAENMKIWTILGLTAVIVAISVCVIELSKIDPANVAVATIALRSVMTMFSIMSVVLALVSNSMAKAGNDSLIALWLLVGVIAVMGVVVLALASMDDPNAAIGIAISLGVMAAGLGIAMNGVAELGKLPFTGILKGIAGMLTILLAFGAFSGVLGELNRLTPGLDEWITAGFPLMRALGQSIGEIAGGFLAGLLGIDIDSIMGALTGFGDGVSTFAESMNGFDEGSVKGVEAMIGMILALAGADLLGAITSLLGGDRTTLSSFGKQLVPFGENLKTFSDTVKDTNSEAVENAAEAASSLTKMANNLPTSGGWKGTILGEKQTLSQFGEGIVEFAGKLVEFCDTIGSSESFSPGLIEECATAASGLVKLVNNLPKAGGIAQTLFGNPGDLGTFGESLVTFAKGIKDFISVENGIGGITSFKPMDDAIVAAEKLVALGDTLPKEDGFFTNLFGGGKTDLGEFGNQLKKFGNAMTSYHESVSSLTSTTGMENAITITQDILTMINTHSLDKVKNLDDLGKKISNLGGKLSGFYADTFYIDASSLSKIITQLDRLVDTLERMDGVDSSTVSGFSEALKTLANTSIDDFCHQFENCSDRVQTAINTMLATLTAGISAKDFEFYNAGAVSASKYVDGITISTSAGSELASGVLNSLTSSLYDFYLKGWESSKKYIEGIKLNNQNAAYAAMLLGTQTLAGFDPLYDSTIIQGKNFAIGFINGISGYNASAYNAAYNIGRSAVNGLRTAIDAHSPSKETQELADWAGIGFVDNLLKWVKQAGEAGEELGYASLDGLNDAIHSIPKMITDEMETSPVIRPIVDLSNAEKSVRSINGMFDRSIAMSSEIAGVTGLAFEGTRTKGTNTQGDSSGSGNTENSKIIYQNNRFEIHSNNPEEVADYVSQRIQKQVERKDSTWARSTGTGAPLVRSR